MGIKPSEISALIKEQIKNYAHEMEQNDVGTIVSVGDGVALVYGLDNTKINEFYIDSVWLDNANIFRNEGYYVADINMKFLIMEV